MREPRDVEKSSRRINPPYQNAGHAPWNAATLPVASQKWVNTRKLKQRREKERLTFPVPKQRPLPFHPCRRFLIAPTITKTFSSSFRLVGGGERLFVREMTRSLNGKFRLGFLRGWVVSIIEHFDKWLLVKVNFDLSNSECSNSATFDELCIIVVSNLTHPISILSPYKISPPSCFFEWSSRR